MLKDYHLNSQKNIHLAPGMRVIIRDAEWVIRSAVMSSDGGQQLTCDGVSELVNGKESIFLTQLEGQIEVLDPAETELVLDDSSGYADSLLYIESQLRRRAINDEQIHIAHKGAMDLVPYQLDPTIQALKQPRQRILIADAVGLGKTLEAGILVSELIQRGRGKRILVLTLKSMMTQFQKELWNRFTIPLTRLDSQGLQRVRNNIPSNHNPFYYYDKSIISIDTLKQDSEYRVYLEQAYWDIIIIDECHNVAERSNNSQRARLAKLLSTRSDTLIMLSATPHDGRAKSFASLMNMLDPTAISDPESYTKDDFSSKGLVVRRFKKDIQNQVNSEFKKRHVYSMRHDASAEEEAAYAALLAIRFTRKGEALSGNSGTLLRVTFQKALFSSPAACAKSVTLRIEKLRNEYESQSELMPEAVAQEVESLEDLSHTLHAIPAEKYAKYASLKQMLTSRSFDWSAKTPNDRLVIFSERIETLHFLQAQLEADLKLKSKQIQIMHGGMSDIEQQHIVEQFGNLESDIRVLLCSDVASEGINLHYQSHRLIHFDLPWSLMVFQQRNGRVDRYGQEMEPQIYYLITQSDNQTIRGDMRILEVLQEKDEQAYNDIGDPSAFMGVFNVDDEERLTQEAMASGQSSEAFDDSYGINVNPNEGDDLLAMFLGTEHSAEDTAIETPSASSVDSIQAPMSLFESDYQWCKQALNQLEKRGETLQFSATDASRSISLTATADLRHRFKFLPKEIAPEEWRFRLTDNIDTIKKEIVRSRDDENAWPKIHYLWQQHPLAEWLSDRMMTAFGRHKAPIITLPLSHGLERGQTQFIFSGLIPNQKSHPLVNEWMVVSFQHGTFKEILPFDYLLEATQLGQRPIPNRGEVEVDQKELQNLQRQLNDAVSHAEKWMQVKRDAFESVINLKLTHQLEELDRLKGRQLEQLELTLNRSSEIQSKLDQKRTNGQQAIDDVFDNYLLWVEQTMTTEKYPYLQLIAAIRGGE